MVRYSPSTTPIFHKYSCAFTSLYMILFFFIIKGQDVNVQSLSCNDINYLIGIFGIKSFYLFIK